MIVEYVVLGGVLVVMGAAQIWLRYGPWAKEQQEAERAVAKRRAERSAAVEADGAADEGPVLMARGSKLWNKWGTILGPLAIAFGLMLVIWGLVDS
jgi:hypothetical protein